MAGDFVLELGDIEGESKHVGMEKKIDLIAFSFGASNPGSNGKGLGAVSLQDVTCTMEMNKASPNIFLSACGGDSFDSVKLHCYEQGGDNEQIEFLMIELFNVIVSNYATSASSGGGKPMDSFSLNFAKVEFSYWPQKSAADGGGQDSVNKKGYDVTTKLKS